MKKEQLENQQYLIKKVALSLAVFVLIALAVRISIAEVNQVTVVLACIMLISYLFIYFFSPKDISQRLSAWFISITNICGILLIVYLSEGLTAPIAVLVPFVSVISFLILKDNEPWVISFAAVVGVLILLHFHQIGHQMPENALDVAGRQTMMAVWLIMVTIITSMSLHYFKQQNKVLEKQLYENSITDHLTGLYNRRYFDQYIFQEHSRSQRTKTWLSVILIDIDHFKLYNDNYGHQAGDDCIKDISRVLQDHFKRSVDMICRYGGEEFLVVLPETHIDKAYGLAEDYRKAIKELNILHGHSPHKIITVSIGVNSVNGHENQSHDELINGADQAMYISKNKGRNQTAIFKPDTISDIEKQ